MNATNVLCAANSDSQPNRVRNFVNLSQDEAVKRLFWSGNWPKRTTIPSEVATSDWVCLAAHEGCTMEQFEAYCWN